MAQNTVVAGVGTRSASVNKAFQRTLRAIQNAVNVRQTCRVVEMASFHRMFADAAAFLWNVQSVLRSACLLPECRLVVAEILAIRMPGRGSAVHAIEA